MPASPVSRPHASAMWTAAASCLTWISGSFASSAASNTGITWLPDSVNTCRISAAASVRATTSAPRILIGAFSRAVEIKRPGRLGRRALSFSLSVRLLQVLADQLGHLEHRDGRLAAEHRLELVI